MEWLTRLNSQLIGLDTSPLIYFIEQNPTYLTVVRAFFQALNQGEFKVVTSTITLTEVLVYPLRTGNIQLARQYRDILLAQQNLVTIPISFAIAELAAQLRATYNLRTPDAIQIATALQEGATFFITNDTRLPEIQKLELLILDRLIT